MKQTKDNLTIFDFEPFNTSDISDQDVNGLRDIDKLNGLSIPVKELLKLSHSTGVFYDFFKKDNKAFKVLFWQNIPYDLANPYRIMLLYGTKYVPLLEKFDKISMPVLQAAAKELFKE